MGAMIIDGKEIASGLRSRVSRGVSSIFDTHSVTPGLAVILVGNDPASETYVRNKARQTIDVGMKSEEIRLAADISQDTLLNHIERLNKDSSIHGILIQLPLPSHIDSNVIINAVHPDKDVDGFHVINAGRLSTGQSCLAPCTPVGCVFLAKEALGGTLDGLHAVIVGRSNIVGKPLAQLLLQENCTVTIAHSRTRDLACLCREADILIAAVGRPLMVKADWVKEGACVIDVGINRVLDDLGKGRLVGDVDFAEVSRVASMITPVPGGVGPMTIACLLRNSLLACCMIHKIAIPQGLE